LALVFPIYFMATHTFDPHGDDDLNDPLLAAVTPPGSTVPDDRATAQNAQSVPVPSDDQASRLMDVVPPTATLTADNRDAQLASDIVREKLARIYAEEPDVGEELSEAEAAGTAGTSGRSRHQQFMYDLGTSGKDLATIQTEWHDYYANLPAEEKHVVWQEFYDSQALMTSPTQQARQAAAANPAQALAGHKNATASLGRSAAIRDKAAKLADIRSASDVQAAIRNTVSAGGQLKVKHHLQSLLFGLGMGMIVVIIFLFGFFNEVVIAPFIQPSRVAAATPLIVNSTSVAPTTQPQVIIPKINVEIPVNYNETSTNEADIENDLEGGVVHYPTTVMPGQAGNTAFFGHSSNNIFNKGKYKFAFVLLHTLVPGDTFYLTYNDKVYVYKVISRTIVDPSDVGVLGPVSGQTATATLITCDPPGTSLHRLIVVGQQISPDPAGNTPATPTATTASTTAPTTLPGNGPTLWTRFISTGLGKAALVVAVLVAFAYTIRRVVKRS
jgi:LPXTG-site transpeptidase (sortase) family protein